MNILIFIEWFNLSVLVELGIIPPLLQEASVKWCMMEGLSGGRHTYVSSGTTVGIIVCLNQCVSVCVAPKCVSTPTHCGTQQSPENLQGSYLHAAAPHFFIKSRDGAAEAPLHHNVTKPHKGKHMRPGRNLQIWPDRWIFFFCSALFYKFKCKLIPRRLPWRARLRRGRRPWRCCAFPNLSLFKPQTIKCAREFWCIISPVQLF